MSEVAMDETVLRHMLGLEGVDIQNASVNSEGCVVVRVATPREAIRCPYCGGTHVRLQGAKLRMVKAPSYGETKIRLEVLVRRMECFTCGRHPQEQFSFLSPYSRCTRGLIAKSIRDCATMTIKNAAGLNGLGWHTVHAALQHHLEERITHIDLSGIQRIAIDEIHVAKGVFMTVVLDLATGHVLHVAQGRGKLALEGFFKDAKAQGAQIEAIAMDMSGAYRSAVAACYPEATVVYDRFHLIQRANQALDGLRRSQWRAARAACDKPLRNCLVSMKYLLLAKPSGIDEAKKANLKTFLQNNSVLARAYTTIQHFRKVIKQPSMPKAASMLDACIEMAKNVGASSFNALANSLQQHRDGIMAFCKYQISSGMLEGKNNRFRTLFRSAYGFRNLEFLRLMIFSTNRGYLV